MIPKVHDPPSDSLSDPGADRIVLVRAIGRWDLTAAAINGVLGAAMFSLPSVLSGLTGAWSPFAYAFGGLGILAIVLCLAEVASRFRDAGGPYLYAREAFGPFIGFQCGWLWFCSRVLAVAAVLNMLVDYLSQVLPEVGTPIGRGATLCAVIALVTTLNVTGVRHTAWSVDVFTLVKLAPLVSLVVFGLTRVRAEVFASQAVLTTDWTQATLLTVYAYSGFEAALVPAGEVRDPRRDSAFALLVSLGVVAAVSMLIQFVVVGLVPHAADSRVPIAAALAVLIGRGGVTVASLAAILAALGWAIGATLACPRILYAMGERGELPRGLARVHGRFRTPHVAILVFSTLCLGFALCGGFAANASLSAVVRLATYGSICAALVVLRRRRPSEVPGFSLRGGTLIAVAGVLFCVGLLCTRTVTQGWVLIVIVVAGTVLWLSARAEGLLGAARRGGD
jgi:APA family basic amino acid/polyamine antiporter